MPNGQKAKSQTKSSGKRGVEINLSDSSVSYAERIDEIRKLTEESLRYSKNLRQAMITQDKEHKQKMGKLMEENVALSREIYSLTKSIKRHIIWQRIWTVLKILIIVVPIVLGAIYLPGLIQDRISPYMDALENVRSSFERDQ